MVSRAERRAFLERSLADLDEEHAAGDLTDEDHARLAADYRRRLAELDRAAAAAAPVPKRRPALVAASAAFVLAVAVGAGVLVAQASGRRAPGQQLSGGGPEPVGTSAATRPEVAEDLGRCFDLAGSEAFDCYIGYTRAHPDDADGFLYFGLYTINQGIAAGSPELLDGGETFLRRALELDPGSVEARANLAVVLERTGRGEEARAELARLEGVELPPDLRQLVDFVERNLAATTSTATTSTTP